MAWMGTLLLLLVYETGLFSVTSPISGWIQGNLSVYPEYTWIHLNQVIPSTIVLQMTHSITAAGTNGSRV